MITSPLKVYICYRQNMFSFFTLYSEIVISLAKISGLRAATMSLALGLSLGSSKVQQWNNSMTGSIEFAFSNLAGNGGRVPKAARYSSVSHAPSSSSSSLVNPVSVSSSLSEINKTKPKTNKQTNDNKHVHYGTL